MEFVNSIERVICMVKTQHDTSKYSSFGILLDKLLAQKKMSFRQLAITSGMSASSQMSIIRACRGESIPKREHVLAWAEILDTTNEQRKALLDAFGYDDRNEQLLLELEEARKRIADLEHQVSELEGENAFLRGDLKSTREEK